MPKKRDGTKITWKEFFQLWKEGIQNLTPLQRLQNEQRATLISLVGYVVSIVAMIVFINKFPVNLLVYGLILVFVGLAYSMTIKFFGIRQQIRAFSSLEVQSINVEDIFNNLKEENKIKEVK